jgi:hypothetical protein
VTDRHRSNQSGGSHREPAADPDLTLSQALLALPGQFRIRCWLEPMLATRALDLRGEVGEQLGDDGTAHRGQAGLRRWSREAGAGFFPAPSVHARRGADAAERRKRRRLGLPRKSGATVLSVKPDLTIG